MSWQHWNKKLITDKTIERWADLHFSIPDEKLTKKLIPAKNASTKMLLEWGTMAFDRDGYHFDITSDYETNFCKDAWKTFQKSGKVVANNLHDVRLCFHFEEARAHFGFVTKDIESIWENYLRELNKRLHELMEDPKGKVLFCIVPENKLVGKMIALKLNKTGYLVHFCETPSVALKWLKDNKPTILTTGVLMPEMGGPELIKKVRKLYPASKLPIVVLSNVYTDEIKSNAIAAGADEYIVYTDITTSNLVKHIQKSFKQLPT